ncbi:MAG TPA: ATP-binding cassette domain-containing protein, partial [Proteobacteria bacterium]|nr:ATP-binding cassette domain-containing protein [Pseudomonadota bacterium]
MIEIVDLKKSFGKTEALKGIDISVYPGEIFGFLGPNGAGKTTTIKIMCGLLKPSGGRVLLDGIDISKDPLRA